MGSTKKRVYYHFDSKPDLFFEIQIVAMLAQIHEISPIAKGPGRPNAKLSRLALKHTQILISDYGMPKVSVQGLERCVLKDAAAELVKTHRSIVRKRNQ